MPPILLRLDAVLRRFFIPLALLGWGIGVLLAFWAAGFPGRGVFLDYNLNAWVMSWQEFGWLRRGLVGSLLHPWFEAVGRSTGAVRWTMIALDGACALGLAFTARAALRALEGAGAPRLAAVLRFGLIVSPVGFVQVGWDVGRYDHVLFLLLAGMAAALLRGRALAAGLTWALAALVHEGALFLFAPAALFAFERGRAVAGRAAAQAALLAPPALAAGALLLLSAQPTDAEIAALWPHLANYDSAWDRPLVVLPLHLRWWEVLPALVYAAAPYMLAAKVARGAGMAPRDLLMPLAMSAPLYALGWDWLRWGQLGFAAMIALLALAVLDRRRAGQGVEDAGEAGGRGAGEAGGPGAPADLPAGGGLGAWWPYLLPLGPLGVARALPPLALLVQALTGWQAPI
ncbi:hypothetical protein ACQ5SO_15515 [Rhodovulum sp. DZ06]|uniref:hypothetical protein n=1 Tax=Rhodovulum sp. DZ06 TaxID=3425126 RepID=UPI003D33F7E5